MFGVILLKVECPPGRRKKKIMFRKLAMEVLLSVQFFFIMNNVEKQSHVIPKKMF